jgi:uncharacterized protein YoxC
MLMSLATAFQQQDAIIAQLDRLNSALAILAWSMGIVGVLSVIAILVCLWTMWNASRLLATIETQINRLAPRTEPLLEKMTRLADDARGITDGVRRQITGVMDTVGDLNDSVVKARREAEKRIREFAAVLDVVQTEAEQLLLDAAATARGVQVTAALLRAARPRSMPRPDDADDEAGDDEGFDEDDDAFDADDEAETWSDDPDDDPLDDDPDDDPLDDDADEDPVPASAEHDREDG